ncbi:predicted protein [Sclerotinia sclerotiorum 1980 UF-70]|uniref:Uncharacterized protein n=2 Tax=Sclerotinia sclerotiorum (strain ATCC 18683 / 1980 / Ss-1) TaxID=665079 RepID=A7EVT1_SCLS1|nr:predicted protein [Sclerotinia sclerotiorum 1980 UF-70]APA15734.1 hypothetical protein sscle_15g105040 [Sclerotinia sclerotiorum 1980 UF-70]EDN93573.1 predicted protein [Sclerotinia sclerotiorum 1980 UF-70]
MQDENLHKVQKPEKKETSTILKRSFSSLASYLKRSQQKPSASSTRKLEGSIISTTTQGESTASRYPSPTREIIELLEGNALTIDVSPATTSAAKPETHQTTSKIKNPCTETAASSSHNLTSALQANMHKDTHIQQTIPQPTNSLSPSTSTSTGTEERDKQLTTTTSENQKRNIQELFIKSLISKLTKERREAKMKVRNSRRIRYLAAMRKIVRKGWSSRTHAGRKRKLDELCR